MSDNLHQALRELKDKLFTAAEAVNQKGLTQYEYGFLGAQDYAAQTIEQLLTQFPEPETTTEWGTCWTRLGGVIEFNVCENEADARRYAELSGEELITREVTAWKKADQ